MKKFELPILLVILAVLAISVRLLPHPANFTPVMAVALFAGYYLPKKWAVILPIAIMLISDLFIGFYDLRLMLVVYSSFVLAGLVGIIIKKHRQVVSVITATLLVSLSFFLITNFAVWAFSSWYAHTWSGLILCYILAVPFFKNTLLGDLFFVGVLFGGYEFIKLALQNSLVRVINK
jgi:hypothetical protein